MGPRLDVQPNELQATAVETTDAGSQSFTIQNSGSDSLSYTVSESISWLSVAPNRGTVTSETDTITVNYDTDALPIGEYNGTITVTAPGADGSPRQVAVTLEVVHRPFDFDGDEDVDLVDFATFQMCYTGPGAPQTDPWCPPIDADGDGDVDTDDLAIFLECLSGANVPSDVHCAD